MHLLTSCRLALLLTARHLIFSPAHCVTFQIISRVGAGIRGGGGKAKVELVSSDEVDSSAEVCK